VVSSGVFGVSNAQFREMKPKGTSSGLLESELKEANRWLRPHSAMPRLFKEGSSVVKITIFYWEHIPGDFHEKGGFLEKGKANYVST